MTKRQIDIDDNLDEILESAFDDVKECLLSYLGDNPDTDELPCLNNDLDYSGSIHEICDSSVPIYTGEQNDLWYLYGNDFEQAFDDAGIGEKNDEGWPMGWKPAAIYCYIEQKVAEWYEQNAQDVFDEWLEKQANDGN